MMVSLYKKKQKSEPFDGNRDGSTKLLKYSTQMVASLLWTAVQLTIKYGST